MAGLAPERSNFDAHQYDTKMNELLASDWQEFFTSYDEVNTFDAMGLQENLLRGIFAYGFEMPSAIQQRGIVPYSKGLDVIQQAQSGTGKAAATFRSEILQELGLDDGLVHCQNKKLRSQEAKANTKKWSKQQHQREQRGTKKACNKYISMELKQPNSSKN